MQQEIELLQSQMCTASDWSQIEVSEGFAPEHIRHARFSGNIRLGAFKKEFELAGGMKKHAGLYHVTLHTHTGAEKTSASSEKNRTDGGMAQMKTMPTSHTRA